MDDLRIPPVPGNSRRLMTPKPTRSDQAEALLHSAGFFAGVVTLLWCLYELLPEITLQMAGALQ